MVIGIGTVLFPVVKLPLITYVSSGFNQLHQNKDCFEYCFFLNHQAPMPNRRKFMVLGMPIPAFFLLLLVFQLFFMPGMMRQGGQLYVPFKKIIVGGSPNNPPYEFLDENNEPAGYLVDLTRAIAAEMKIEVDIRLAERTQLVEEFGQGKIDLLQGMTRTNILTGDHPFFSLSTYSQKLFSRHEYPRRITGLEQLKSGTLAVSRDTPFLNTLLNGNPQLEIRIVESHAQALQLLSHGECDFALIVNLPSPFLSRELAFLNQHQAAEKIFQIGELKTQLHYGYLIRNDDSYLFDLLNSSLNVLQLSGRQQEIQEQWLGHNTGQEISRREKTVQLGGLIFSPLLLVICTIFFWNNSLKKEVERRSKEIAVQQSQLLQADKMTSLGTLVAGVAHEINNPTGLILHNLATLKRIYQSSEAILEERFEEKGDFLISGMPYSVLREDAAQIFSEMQDSAHKIIQIVDDLKDFSRKDSHTLSEEVDLNQVVNAALRLLEGSLKKQITKVRFDSTADLPPFCGNGSQIEQVIVNLILNACQASESSGGEILVRTFLDEQHRELVLQVRDQGVGIAAENMPFLCDPFFTTKREHGGTGLGLSISDRIVKEHQGRLEFISDIGHGTTVSLFLPICKREELS